MELRQLQYFLTLAEELHFGRAAAREHIVQSALSQHIRRLEREIGVDLVERTTHFVRLTRAGEALVTEVRAVLRGVERAVVVAREASLDAEVLRVAVGDASLDSMPQVLRSVQYNHSNLVIHRLEVPVPIQYRMLAEGTLDVGLGCASRVPAGIDSEVFRLDPLGVLVAESHPLAVVEMVSVRSLEGEPLVLAEDDLAPEFNEVVVEICGRAGFGPTRFPGSVQSVRAAAEVVKQQRGLAVVASSCDLLMPGIRWRQLEPICLYPWSLFWRTSDRSWPIEVVRVSARALATKLGWLDGRGAVI